MSDYGIQFADWCEFPPETMVGETVFDSEGKAIGWIVNATAERSCASCPEMANPDSYINHLHAALEWYDEHVPRQTNPRNTCVVLEGEKPPEEVMFVGPDGVTHYLPEETCHFKVVIDQDPSRRGRGNICECDKCGYRCARGFIEDERFKHCPNCGKRIKEEAE